ATAAVLRGAQVSEVAAVDALQAISDGNLNIDVDGVQAVLTALDFSVATSLADIAAVIDTAITGSGATVTVSNSRIVITSDTTGATSLITFATAGATGTFIGDILGLSAGSGATTTQGAAANSLALESKVDALVAIKSQIE